MNSKPVIIGVVIALALAGGYYVFTQFKTTPSDVFPMKCAYDECGWTGDLELKLGDWYPPKCPKCGKQSVLPVSKCPKCGNLQISNGRLRNHIPGKEKLPATTNCNKCGTRISQGN